VGQARHHGREVVDWFLEVYQGEAEKMYQRVAFFVTAELLPCFRGQPSTIGPKNFDYPRGLESTMPDGELDEQIGCSVVRC